MPPPLLLEGKAGFPSLSESSLLPSVWGICLSCSLLPTKRAVERTALVPSHPVSTMSMGGARGPYPLCCWLGNRLCASGSHAPKTDESRAVRALTTCVTKSMWGAGGDLAARPVSREGEAKHMPSSWTACQTHSNLSALRKQRINTNTHTHTPFAPP